MPSCNKSLIKGGNVAVVIANFPPTISISCKAYISVANISGEYACISSITIFE